MKLGVNMRPLRRDLPKEKSLRLSWRLTMRMVVQHLLQLA